MSRPRKWRKIAHYSPENVFRPRTTPVPEEVVLEPDELEALRLGDFEGLYHEEAAARMEISRATFSRIIERARKKVADALLHSKVIRVSGEEQQAQQPQPPPFQQAQNQ